jgi:hypothetical protein
MIGFIQDHSPMITKWGIGMFATAVGLTVSALEEIRLYMQIAAGAMAFIASATTFFIVVRAEKRKRLNEQKDNP